MTNLLQQLDSNEAILLMFLSGELGEEDRAEVERMLAHDAALRSQLAELEQAQAGCDEVLRRLDRLAAPPDALVLSRRVLRGVRRHQMERLARTVEPEEPERSRRAWWSYGLVGSAAAALLMLVWWTYQEPAMTNYPELAGSGPGQYQMGQYEEAQRRLELAQEFLQVSSETSESLTAAEAHWHALSSGQFEEPFFFVFADDSFDLSEGF